MDDRTERSSRDLREILPELQEVVRSSRFKPYGFLQAVALGIHRGLAMTRELPHLRTSYFKSLAVVGLAMVVQIAILVWLSTDIEVLTPLLASAIWFVLGGVLVYSQLTLVRRQDGRPYDRFGIPNTLTLYRFLNIPFLIALLPLLPQDRGILILGVTVFALTALSDVADGNYARLTGQVSEFGRIYDPICDIAINAGVCLGAWAAGFLPFWYVLIAETRFFLPLIGGAWLYAYRKPWRIRPTFWGKITVFVYDLFIGLLFLKELSGAGFLEDLTRQFFWLSIIMFAFNIVVMIDKGVTMMVGTRDQEPREK